MTSFLLVFFSVPPYSWMPYENPFINYTLPALYGLSVIYSGYMIYKCPIDYSSTKSPIQNLAFTLTQLTLASRIFYTSNPLICQKTPTQTICNYALSVELSLNKIVEGSLVSYAYYKAVGATLSLLLNLKNLPEYWESLRTFEFGDERNNPRFLPFPPQPPKRLSSDSLIPEEALNPPSVAYTEPMIYPLSSIQSSLSVRETHAPESSPSLLKKVQRVRPVKEKPFYRKPPPIIIKEETKEELPPEAQKGLERVAELRTLKVVSWKEVEPGFNHLTKYLDARIEPITGSEYRLVWGIFSTNGDDKEVRLKFEKPHGRNKEYTKDGKERVLNVQKIAFVRGRHSIEAIERYVRYSKLKLYPGLVFFLFGNKNQVNF